MQASAVTKNVSWLVRYNIHAGDVDKLNRQLHDAVMPVYKRLIVISIEVVKVFDIT